MRRWGLVIAMLLATAVAASAQTTGLARLTDLWALPDLTPGIVAFGASSTDPTGGNDDGFTGIWSRQYWDDGRHVLFDAQGPGCVYRMWFTKLGKRANLQFFFDNEPMPSLDLPLTDFFAGATAPFTETLLWDDMDSRGGFVHYVPVCYRERLVIATTALTYFYNFTAHRYWSDAAVETFTGAENYDQARALYDPARAGEDPKDAAGVDYAELSATVAPGETVELADLSGPGWIASLELTPATLDAALLNDVRLVAVFDEAAVAQIDAPLGVLVGTTDPAAEATALLWGLLDGRMYWYLPMPFFAAAKLALVNDGDATASFTGRLGVRAGQPDDHAGLLIAQYNRSKPTRLGRDHPFAVVGGQGKIVGVTQLAGGLKDQGYLEGDERWYPDGLSTPTIQGTGTEDYYNAGWYFNQGPFTLPTHGHPSLYEEDDYLVTAMYRLHTGDSLDFYHGAVFSIEHDMLNLNTREDERSAAYLYHVDEPALVLQAAFDVGDPTEEERFAFVGGDDEDLGPLYGFYEGDQDLLPILDAGYRSRTTARFTVAVNPHNDGLRLVRRIDQRWGRELVRVTVNGRDAGLWGATEHNFFKRWRDVVFDIPPALTKGCDLVEIELTNRGEQFTQLHYWLYAFKRPLLTRLSDLALSAPTDELRVGDTLALSVGGVYPSGAEIDIAGWVDYALSDPALAEVVHGELTAFAPGELTLTASTGAQTSNALTLTILPATDDDADTTPDDDDTTDDDDDDDDGCGC